MDRPVIYFGGFNMLLSMWRLNHSSPTSSKARLLCNAIFRILFNKAPFLAFFILLTISFMSEEPAKLTSKYIVPVLLFILNLSNVATLNARFDKLDALINLVPAVSKSRIRAQLNWWGKRINIYKISPKYYCWVQVKTLFCLEKLQMHCLNVSKCF